MNSTAILTIPPATLASAPTGSMTNDWIKPAGINPLNDLTEVRISATHGRGVFAKVAIPQHTVWWRVCPTNVTGITQAQYAAFVASAPSPQSDPFMAAILHFGYYVQQYDAIFFALDNARYINHSFQPNSAVSSHSDDLCSVAVRDIAPGEEICEDYTHYDQCPWARLYGEFGRQIGCWTE